MCVGLTKIDFLIKSFLHQENTQIGFYYSEQWHNPIGVLKSGAENEQHQVAKTCSDSTTGTGLAPSQQALDCSNPALWCWQLCTTANMHSPPTPKVLCVGFCCCSESEAIQQHPRGQCQDPSMGWAASCSRKIKDIGVGGKEESIWVKEGGWEGKGLSTWGKAPAVSKGVHLQRIISSVGTLQHHVTCFFESGITYCS